MFAVENFFEASDRFDNGHVLPFEPCENFRHVKGLAEKSLNFYMKGGIDTIKEG